MSFGNMLNRMGVTARNIGASAIPTPKKHPRVLIALGTFVGIFSLCFMTTVLMYGFVPTSAPNVTRQEKAPAGNTLATAFRDTMQREIDHGWLYNDCCWLTVFLVPYQNFEAGQIDVWRRFAQQLRDNLSRVRGSDSMDSRIENVNAALNNKMDGWWFPNFEDKLQEAVDGLNLYIRDLPERKNFSARADNLGKLAESLASMMGGTLNTIAQALPPRSDVSGGQSYESGGDVPLGFFGAQRVFYHAKGQAYATLMILQAVRIEFGTGPDSVLAQKNATELVGHATFWLEKAIHVSPWVVRNGSPNDQFTPNHLDNFGLYFGQARDKIDSLADLLRNG